jgi:ABC-2 type transport system ATP-binding protein
MRINGDDPVLVAAGLTVGYRGRPVLHELNLRFGPGLHLILGPNGAGKTTLFRALAGVLRPSAGSVRIRGADPAADASVKRYVGVGAHRAALAPRLTVAGNLDYWARVIGLPASRRKAAIDRVTGILGLDEIAGQRAGSLSRGQSQRASLARAMLADPPVLLLDEPFAGIDPAVAVQLRGYLRALAAEDRTLLVSTHELAEASEIGDDVTVLRDGRVIGQGAARELRGTLLGNSYRLRIKGSGDLAGVLGRLGYDGRSGDGRDGRLGYDGDRGDGAPDGRDGDSTAVVTVADEREAQRLIASLIGAGVAISEAGPAANPLEDLYLHLQEGQA